MASEEMTETEQMSIRFKDVFGSENGKKVLEDLDRNCLYKRSAFDTESERKTCYKLGAQWVVNYIHSMIDRNLMNEQKNEVIDEGTIL